MVEAAVQKYDPDRINQLIDSVIDDVYPMAQSGVVSSKDIAGSVLRHFREFDEVSQVRFALVQMGRLDRTDGRTGWRDVRDVRWWLREEYPELQYHRSPVGLVEVVKRNWDVEPFSVEKITRGIEIAAKGRGTSEDVRRLAVGVADDVERELGDQPRVTSGQIATEIFRSLRHRDQIAYLRFASTAKRFRTPTDYEDEAVALRNASQCG
jgi:transcriptional regulator NrdR family protein